MVRLRQPIDAESFLAWIVQFLVQVLRPGDIVVMDNLSSHKNKAMRYTSWTYEAGRFEMDRHLELLRLAGFQEAASPVLTTLKARHRHRIMRT
jgi:hypothetical protein